ncbi:hypothetical protein QR680_000827 [Steinernema hermaphroditum]|uniref:Uncharacterized protein n=1 Tax=Steinernema hermaphroditum TaxID=289476 RepID=A0AA39GW54_9BILA|nr:hypothetical protein QR680_000827 [Steinernema hermaphroditum]
METEGSQARTITLGTWEYTPWNYPFWKYAVRTIPIWSLTAEEKKALDLPTSDGEPVIKGSRNIFSQVLEEIIVDEIEDLVNDMVKSTEKQ